MDVKLPGFPGIQLDNFDLLPEVGLEAGLARYLKPNGFQGAAMVSQIRKVLTHG